MSSGGGKNTTTVQNSGPPAWAVPYFQGALNKANQVANQPYQQYQGPRIAGFTGDQEAGFDYVRQQALNGNPLLNAGHSYATNQLSGANQFNVEKNQFAGQNPYLNQMVQDEQSDVTGAYQNSTLPNLLSQFSGSGAFGGTAMQQALSQSNQDLAGQLGRVSTNLRSADYQNQQQLDESYLNRKQQAWGQNQGNSLSALGMVPALGDAKYTDARALMNIGQQGQNLWQSVLDTDFEDFQDSQNWNAKQLGVLTNALGAVQGGQSSSTGANPNYRSAGQNAAGYAALLASLWG